MSAVIADYRFRSVWIQTASAYPFGLIVSTNSNVFRFMVVLSLLLLSEQVHADKPIISYLDKNGSLGMGVWYIKIDIFKNGKVHYFGKGSAVYIQGDRYSKISKTELKNLIDAFTDTHFLEIKLQPTVWDLWKPPLLLPPITYDLPSPPTITFRYRRRERTTARFFEGIYDLREKIFRTVNLKQWVCFPTDKNIDNINCNLWHN